jgi:hypothetical protein
MRRFAGSGTGATGLEPAASGVTGRRSNQLSYAPGDVRVYGSPGAPREPIGLAVLLRT